MSFYPGKQRQDHRHGRPAHHQKVSRRDGRPVQSARDSFNPQRSEVEEALDFERREE